MDREEKQEEASESSCNEASISITQYHSLLRAKLNEINVNNFKDI